MTKTQLKKIIKHLAQSAQGVAYYSTTVMQTKEFNQALQALNADVEEALAAIKPRRKVTK